MAHVYTYWECSYCKSLIRGDSRTCPNCGAPIPNDVKYLMPDNEKVIKARKEGKILIGNTHIDEKGIVADIVEKKDERDKPNWLCEHCGYQNFDEDTTCRGCGAEKTTKNYFSDKDESFDEPEESEEESESTTKSETEKSNKLSDIKNKIFGIISNIPVNYAIYFGIGIIALIFLIWLFTPVTRVTTVQGFKWQRTIDVEEYTLCHESGWSTPAGATVTDTREEIHHYDTVLDHYETKTREVSEQVFDGYDTETRQVSEQVFDGYDTSYRDLGNGQAEMVQTPRYRTEYRTETYQVPRYRTEWHTETYQEPVYVQVPVYQTKYYYDIGRWKYVYNLPTSGSDQEPYWHNTDLPSDVFDPNYGDLKQTSRHEKYIVIILNEDGESIETEYDFNLWTTLLPGDKLTYKSFRFTYRPLTEVEIKHAD